MHKNKKRKPSPIFSGMQPFAIFISKANQRFTTNSGADFWGWENSWDQVRESLKFLISQELPPKEIAIYTSVDPSTIPPDVAAIARLVHTSLPRS